MANNNRARASGAEAVRKLVPGGKVRLVMADEHISVREMTAAALHLEGCYEVVGHARTGWEAVEVCGRLRPDVAIVDLLLPGLNGAEVVRRIRTELPETRVLVYSGKVHTTLAAEALRAKPHGYVQKQDTLETLRAGVRAVAQGQCFFTGFAAGLLHEPPERDRQFASLSERERVVLQMVAEGWQTKEIAVRLGIAPKTVEHHRASLMGKVERRDVAGLTRFAMKVGLVPPE